MRRGSALLIVLGMVSFMVVSAIGFSVYMRESRKPSSFLRRESTARYLLKSALANAISRIDGEVTRNAPGNAERLEGVYDDVYPGLTRNISTIQDNGNYWSHRVFTPFGPVGSQETVSTLTLEGLAYLPPAIINEARAFSRLTRTARWSNLSYDLGRYAFTAIDVSDCFDINKLAAGLRRSSAAGSRVNLSSLFPQDGAELDNLLTKWEDGDGVPFVSLADFNVASGKTRFTPFCKYIGSSSGEKIYTTSDHQAVSNALFITDTWFPATNDYLTADLERKSKTTTGVYDLAKGGEDQPFRTFDANSFMDPLEGQTRFMREVGIRNLGTPGVACLYDYLDRDSVPLSLCLPCVETAPMVCGIGFTPGPDFILKVNPTAETVTGDHETGRLDPASGQAVMETVTATKYTLEIPAMQIPVKTLVSFPFRRTALDGKQTGGYTFKAVARIFFAPDRLECRLDANTPIRPERTSDWTSGYANGILTVPCDFSGTISPQNKPTTDQTLFELTGQMNVQSQVLQLFWKVEKSLQAGATGATTLPQRYYSLDGIKTANDRLQPFDATGKLVDWAAAFAANPAMPQVNAGKWTDLPAVAKDDLTTDLSALELIPHVALWVRIEKGGDVVDLVPACPRDDVSYGRRDAIAEEAGLASGFCGGTGKPILEFCGDPQKKFKIGLNGMGTLDGQPDPFLWTQLFTADPRFNFAPENWWAVNGFVDLKTNWKSAIVDNFLAKDGRDKDVFMFTSDQEYLQSVGEVQFLPFLQETNGRAQGFECTYKSRVNYNGRPMADRVLTAGQSPDSLANNNKLGAHDFLWRTYRAYDRNGGWDRDRCNPFDFEDAGGKRVEVVSGTGGFRVNPFSRDSRIMSSVVGDTPYDYHIASTNENRNTHANMSGSAARALAFGENGSCEKWNAQDVEEISAELREAFDDAYDQDGVTDFAEVLGDYLNWEADGEKNDDQLNFLAEDLDLADPLYGVDRKFLCAFWRECFQNRQQLFLVFLRAEPLTVGGSSGDAIANAQLGARGVALVWRDPAPPPGNGQRKNRTALSSRSAWREQCKQTGPHRTRVLFYHQFD